MSARGRRPDYGENWSSWVANSHFLEPFYCATQICIVRILATATWLGGWLSVTRRYCIKTAKPILKLFRLSGNPIILVSSDPYADTQFQGEPLQRGVKHTGGGENSRFSCDFRRKSPFISETVPVRPMVSMERH